MFNALDSIKTRVEEINNEISHPDIFNNRKKYLSLIKEKAELDPIVINYNNILKTKKNLDEAELILKTEKDKELLELAQDEKIELTEKYEKQLVDLKVMMLPKDPKDSRNTIIEIRSGAGGEEAALFATDLFKMYQKYAESQNWKVELISLHKTELGGIREISFSVVGKNVYKSFKFESGVHRVQRVPTTESGGRIHTSTITVAVLPEPEEVDIKLDVKDIKMDFFHSSGPGGQNVNKLSTAVRLTHIPSGVVVVCQDERSQAKNRETAMKVLKARLYDAKIKEEENKISSQRKSQVGSGDRSERIRTYNFPQKRVTDHRINFSIYRLEEILDGNFNLLLSKLVEEDQKMRLNALIKSENKK